jgi:hypothetical protein
MSICIFPEGGVPEESVELDTFKDGAFKMAIAHQIPVVPIIFYDNKKRFPFRFFSGGPLFFTTTRSDFLSVFSVGALVRCAPGSLGFSQPAIWKKPTRGNCGIRFGRLSWTACGRARNPGKGDFDPGGEHLPETRT